MYGIEQMAPELITSCFKHYLIFAVLSSGAAGSLKVD